MMTMITISSHHNYNTYYAESCQVKTISQADRGHVEAAPVGPLYYTIPYHTILYYVIVDYTM